MINEVVHWNRLSAGRVKIARGLAILGRGYADRSDRWVSLLNPRRTTSLSWAPCLQNDSQLLVSSLLSSFSSLSQLVLQSIPYFRISDFIFPHYHEHLGFLDIVRLKLVVVSI